MRTLFRRAIFNACFYLFFLPTFAIAQRIPERFFVIDPLSQPVAASVVAKAADSTCVWMPGFGFWSGFERYAASDNAHAWRNPFGAFAEIVRFHHAKSPSDNPRANAKKASIFAIGTFEHVADPNNDISFNPRAVWWEEGIIYATELDSLRFSETRAAANSLQIGYFHRCRHEVDNFFRGESRVMIYGSITGKYLLHLPLGDSENPAEHALIAARADIYTIRTDYRFPFRHTSTLPSYFDLVGSLGINAHYRNKLPWAQLGWWASARLLGGTYAANREFFGRFGAINAARLDYGASLGISIEGAVRCQIGLNYEYLADTEMKPFPEPQHLVSVGFTFLSPQGIW